MGNTQCTQNIQVNKVLGENEKWDVYFKDKSERTFWPTQCYVYNTRCAVPRRWVSLLIAV